MSKQKSWMDAYDEDKGWGGKKATTSDGWKGGNTGTGFQRCYHTHPLLPIGKYVVSGGSCSSPVKNDADIYIGLDYGMKQHKQRLPWEPGHAIHYEIQDMHAPKDAEDFKKLISWLAEEIEGGAKVHVGCIGGHGRTGTLFAALVAHMTDEEDAITYVREHYCKKAVEAKSQIEFLVKHFGCKTAKPTKGGWTSGTSKKGKQGSGQMSVDPIAAKHCVWGSRKVKRD